MTPAIRPGRRFRLPFTNGCPGGRVSGRSAVSAGDCHAVPARGEAMQQMTPTRGRWWALVALSFAMLAVGIDLTVLNVALPTLGESLHASTSQLQWFVDSYSLVLAALLLPAGILADRYGRKRLLLVSLAVFAASSAGC